MVFLPWVFSLSLFWFSPILLQGQWVNSCMGLGCQLGLNHTDTEFFLFFWNKTENSWNSVSIFRLLIKNSLPGTAARLTISLWEKAESFSIFHSDDWKIEVHFWGGYACMQEFCLLWLHNIFSEYIFFFFSWNIASDLLKSILPINHPLKVLKKMSAEEQSIPSIPKKSWKLQSWMLSIFPCMHTKKPKP